MFFRHAMGFLLILTTAALPTFGQMRSAPRASSSMDGTVLDENTHQPLGNVRVDLKQSSGIPLNTTFTNSDGRFEFNGLANGSYVVEIDVKDYESVRQSVEIRDNARENISISMNRSAIVVNSSSLGTISAHQLSVPHKARDEYEKGMELLFRKSDYQGAIAQFQRAIRDFPTYYEAYADMASAYVGLRQMGPAVESLRKSVDLSSGRYSQALVLLADLLNSMNRYQEAVTFAKKMTEVESSSWQGPFELARALSGLNQVQEAEKNAIQARDLNPANPPVYLMLANIHIHLHDYSALLHDLDSYLKLKPSGTDADQARKLRDELLVSNRQTEQRPDRQMTNSAQGQSIDGSASSSPDKKEPPPLEPDLSGLPSLPPPSNP